MYKNLPGMSSPKEPAPYYKVRVLQGMSSPGYDFSCIPHRTPRYHGFNKLESTLPKGDSTCLNFSVPLMDSEKIFKDCSQIIILC